MAGKRPTRRKTKKRPSRRRSLTHTGGSVEIDGDPQLAEVLGVACRPAPGDDGRDLTHGFHPWPGRTHPHDARTLLRALPEGQRVFDPFMGSGTVITEAMIAGHQALGCDVNPVAIEVAWARTRVWGEARRKELIRAGGQAIRRARSLRDRRGVPPDVREREGSWYDPPALAEVWSLTEVLGAAGGGPKDVDIGRMLRICLSSILVRASRQASDSVTRVDREHKWIPRGRVEQWFTARIEEHANSLGRLGDALVGEGHEPVLRLADCRLPWKDLDSGVDAIITSPPYPGVFDYVDHHRRRYRVLGLDPTAAHRDEMGSRRQMDREGPEEASGAYVRDMAGLLQRWRKILRPGARAFLVLGDGQHRHGLIPVLPLLEEAALQAGMDPVAMASQTRPIFGAARQETGAVRHEHLLALEVGR